MDNFILCRNKYIFTDGKFEESEAVEWSIIPEFSGVMKRPQNRTTEQKRIECKGNLL